MSLKLGWLALCILISTSVTAQSENNPEVARMQESARSYLNKADYSNAIMMYAQAIRMAPGDVSLRRDLAYAYFLSGDLDKAQETINPIVNSTEADEQTFQLASAIENKLGNTSKAKRIINNGISKYEQSGLLYNTKGNLLLGDKKTKDALEAYNKGIQVEPSFASNYFSAAKIYSENKEAVWALLYAEIYLNLDPYNNKTVEMKNILFNNYTVLFMPNKNDKLPDFNSNSNTTNSTPQFIDAFKQCMTLGTTVIRDGINTENLIMLRTRFLLNWNKNFSINYPYTLFTMQQKMLRDGVYDAYNQWLFGAMDNSSQFSLWVKTNSKEYAAFENWRKLNPLQPAAYDPKPSK
jgi:tetratricopeptide (TPR) repeat protein